MTTLSKLQLIKEYILSDRNRFLLANDIYTNFAEITESLKDSVYSLFEKEIRNKFPEAIIKTHRFYANNQYLDIVCNNDVIIQIQFWNFFKNPLMTISKLNSENAAMINDIIEGSQFQDDRVQVILNKYNFNRMNSILDLYDLYKDDDLKMELLTNFNNNILPAIIKTYEIVK